MFQWHPFDLVWTVNWKFIARNHSTDTEPARRISGTALQTMDPESVWSPAWQNVSSLSFWKISALISKSRLHEHLQLVRFKKKTPCKTAKIWRYFHRIIHDKYIRVISAAHDVQLWISIIQWWVSIIGYASQWISIIQKRRNTQFSYDTYIWMHIHQYFSYE